MMMTMMMLLTLCVSRHDMSGYTGHKPRCVLNQCGPRNPATKEYKALSMSASLILESRK